MYPISNPNCSSATPRLYSTIPAWFFGKPWQAQQWHIFHEPQIVKLAMIMRWFMMKLNSTHMRIQFNMSNEKNQDFQKHDLISKCLQELAARWMKGTSIGTQEPPSSSLHHWHGLSENPHKSISHQSMFPPFLLKKSGWWFQPLWKILVTWEYYSQYIGKIKFMFQTTNQKLSTQNHL